MAEQQKYSGLELLPTALLEEIIRTDFNGEGTYSEDMIEYVLALLAERRKEEQPDTIPDVQEAWMRLQLGKEAPREKPRRKRILRYVSLVAACVAILFAMLISAQAMGVDVFGAFGKWTDGTFQFEVPKEEPSTVFEEAVAEAFSEVGIPLALFPTQIPESYMLLRIERNELEAVKYLHVAYTKANGEKALTIQVEEYLDTAFMEGKKHEKNAGTPFLYAKNGRQFYVFENSGTWTATWCDAVYGITICGADSKETVIAMIDSIPELTEGENPVEKALSEAGLPTSLTPFWIPEEYALSELDSFDIKLCKGVFAAYYAPGKEHLITVEICEYYDANFLNDKVFFKSSGPPEIYLKNGRQFYIFRNADTWTATWSDTVYCITIGGAYSKETAMAIIDSI